MHRCPLPFLRSGLNSTFIVSGYIRGCLGDPEVLSSLLEVWMRPRRPDEIDRRLSVVG